MGARIAHGRQRNQGGEPVKQRLHCRRHITGGARPDRNRQQHDVGRGKAGDARALQEGLIGCALRIDRIDGELCGLEAGAVQCVRQIGACACGALCTATTRAAERFARALTTPGRAPSAFSTLRMQAPQCMPCTASVVVTSGAPCGVMRVALQWPASGL